MAGRGRAPKPADRRARTNADPMPMRVLPLVRSEAPLLPGGVNWHPRTIEWWEMWTESELAKDFTAADWSFLLDTALLHHQLWALGDMKAAPELRLRVAKFGATPEDRARLRITFADADERDGRRRDASVTTVGSVRERYNRRAAAE